MRDLKLLWVIVFAVTAVGLPAGTQAQNVQASSSLEEILVTARRREENLQDVPVSIQAFSGNEMELRGIERVEDVVAAAPNVMVSAGPSTAFNQFSMRGIPRAGFFVDDVWQQSSLSLSQRSVVELDRVEVLRGPQGTLYGRDTTGGAIRLYTKAPAREFGVRANATVGNYNRRDLAIYADLPISDTLFSKISISSQNRDGYIESISIDRAYGDIDDRNIRADLLWVPNDQFQARFTFEDEQFEGSQANATLQIFDPGAPGVDAGFIDPLGRSLFWVPNSQYYALVGVEYNCRTQVMNCPGGLVGDLENRAVYEGPGIIIDLQNYNLKLDYTFSEEISISSLSHYHEQYSWDYNNFTASDTLYFSQGSSRDREGFTQEIQISGDHDRFNWVLGGYYFDEKEINHFNRWALWEFVNGTHDFNDVRNSPECSSFFIPAFPGGPPQGALSGLIPCIQVPPSQDSMTSFSEHGFAIFGELTFNITDTLGLTVGARYHDQTHTDRTELFGPGTALRADTPGTIPAGNPFISGGQTGARTSKFDQNTYRLALTQHFDDNKMLYAGFSQGYNAGGISRVQIFDLDNNAINFDFPFDPEQIDNYELGWRSDLADGKLRFNATLFFTEWQDIQLAGTVINPFTGVVLPTFLTTNAAVAEAKGAEFEITWLPNEHWQFDLDVGFLNTKYTDIAEGSELDLDSNFGQAPEQQYSAGAQWNGNLFDGGTGVILRADYMYTAGYNRTYVPGDCSCRYSGEEFEQSSFGLLNARVIFQPSDKWELALFGTNLTDERYTDGGFMSPLLQVDDGTIGRPREYGLSVSFSFQ